MLVFLDSLSLGKMAKDVTTITFDLSKDPFQNSGEEGLDKKWFDLAELLLGEDRSKRKYSNII